MHFIILILLIIEIVLLILIFWQQKKFCQNNKIIDFDNFKNQILSQNFFQKIKMKSLIIYLKLMKNLKIILSRNSIILLNYLLKILG